MPCTAHRLRPLKAESSPFRSRASTSSAGKRGRPSSACGRWWITPNAIMGVALLLHARLGNEHEFVLSSPCGPDSVGFAISAVPSYIVGGSEATACLQTARTTGSREDIGTTGLGSSSQPPRAPSRVAAGSSSPSYSQLIKGRSGAAGKSELGACSSTSRLHTPRR
jgi:hypothetical protein